MSDGTAIPASVLEFVPADWPGDSRSKFYDDHARFQAWDLARTEWASANLAKGVEDLPEFKGDVPDAPFDLSLI